MPNQVSIGVLGPLRVDVDGNVIRLNGVRLHTLVVLLALAPGREVSRTSLMDAVWGEQLPSRPDNALQALVSRLRRAVPELEVESRPTGYRALIDPDQVDAHRFESLVQAARRSTDTTERAATLRTALGLWRGTPLPGLPDTPVLRAHAARLSELRRAAIEERVAAELDLGRGAELVAELEGLVAEYPLRETLRIQLMAALQAAGRYADALAVYEDARTVLAERLGADPSPQLRAAHLALLRAGAPQPVGAAQVGAPAKPVVAPSPVRLPAPLTPLIGRDGDIRRVRALLAEHRLVTIVGPGGAGKTRVAIEAAREIADPGTTSVWLVELAGLTDAEDVPRAILDATGAGDGGLLFAPGPPGARPRVWDRLVDVLYHAPALLVLDNCEHLLPHAARIAGALLSACPRLRLLATSRQVLGLYGESLHQLSGLPVPAATGPATQDSPAVRLFVARARAACPSFVLDQETAAPVAAVCRALDGLPLALELAAARLRSLPVAQLADRLRDRLDLLSSGSAAVDARHRTLRAVIDWSWDLLDPDERVLARRMAVFADRMEASAVRRVCAGVDDLPAHDVDRLLAGLVDKSLVHADGDGARLRLRMLDTVRLYALERLAAAGEEHRFRLRHAQAMLELAEDCEPRMRRAEQTQALALLAERVDDLTAALRWSAEHAPETAVRLVAALEWFWLLSGRRAEGMEWTDRALALDGSGVPAARALLCTVGALAHGALFGQPAGIAYLNEAVALSSWLAERPESGGHPSMVLTRALVPLLAKDAGAMLDALRRCAHDADPWVRAQSRMLAGRILMNDGQPFAARAELLAALDGFGAIGERLGLAQSLCALAELDTMGGEHASAAARLTEALRVASELGADEDKAMLRVRLGAVRARAGEGAAARTELDAALADARRLGLGETAGAAYHVLGDLERWEGRFDVARGLLDRALSEVQAHGRGIGYLPAVLASQGFLAVAEGRLTDAAELCRDTYDLARQGHDAQFTSRVAVLAAAIALARSQPAQSAALLQAAAAMRGQPVGADPDEAAVCAAVPPTPARQPAALLRAAAAEEIETLLHQLVAAG
ncbi:MAG: winged helix-turn-helix domain-containing protein [Micromonosporaceae bacterium]|nr:winged helix-turn-helix domain-containing protein [Micromonosporaceae bacterium]